MSLTWPDDALARVRFTLDGREGVAVLWGTRRWTCAAFPALEEPLNGMFGDFRWDPSMGRMGVDQAVEAAEWLEGEAEFPELPPVEPGDIS
jgi:hypothetical protein